MSDFSTDAILLRKIEYGDHDLIISFLTKDCGKLSVIAKNAKKSVRRFTGALDLFSINHIQCARPKKKKDAMVHLAKAHLENGLGNIRYDVFKTAYASYWVEMVYSWLEEEKPQEQLFDLLRFSLDMLDKGTIEKSVLSLLFQIRFMHISGFSPRIDNCEDCGKTLDRIDQQKVWFDFSQGRLICPDCRSRKKSKGMQVSKGTLKQLAWINSTPMDRAERIRFSGVAIREGERLLESFIPFHVQKNFKSLQFLNKMRAIL